MANAFQDESAAKAVPAPPARSRGEAFLELIGLIGPDLPPSDDPKRTARAIRLMLTTIVLLLLIIAIWVIVENMTMVTFVWSLVVAGCALLAGAALGVLFGLPSKRTVEVRTIGVTAATGANPADSGSPGKGNPSASAEGDSVNQDTGYVESTNLERVADWLTTMIIGLTLTQYGAWEARYFDLSRSATAAMEIRLDICAPAVVSRHMVALPGSTGGASSLASTEGAPRKLTKAERDCMNAQAIPGGMLMAIFAILGFLVSYLWMRRYFIFEMVTAREEERQRYRRKLEKEQLSDDPLKAALAQIATANAERDAAIATAEATKVKAAADIETARNAELLATAKANAAAAETARVAAQLQTNNQIVEASPDRTPATVEAIQAIAEKTRAAAPQVDVVSKSLNDIIGEIRNNAVTYPGDPWRARLSGQAAGKGFSLSASVRTNELDANLFDLNIKVHSDDAAANIGKSVWFLLHPTFGAEPRGAAFDANGDAVLSLVTYGAFTVGAIMEDGTVLELNLAEIEAPQAFRQR